MFQNIGGKKLWFFFSKGTAFSIHVLNRISHELNPRTASYLSFPKRARWAVAAVRRWELSGPPCEGQASVIRAETRLGASPGQCFSPSSPGRLCFSSWAPKQHLGDPWSQEGGMQLVNSTLKSGSFHLPTADSSASHLGKCDLWSLQLKVPGDTGMCNMCPNLCRSQEAAFKFAPWQLLCWPWNVNPCRKLGWKAAAFSSCANGLIHQMTLPSSPSCWQLYSLVFDEKWIWVLRSSLLLFIYWKKNMSL